MNLPDINADRRQRVVVESAGMAWEASPSGSVWRKPLYRQGGERGPVTSIVRYDAGGVFPIHFHPQGEEILVLEGVFSDEHGDYPTGTYLLNPDGSHHAPFSRSGCTLFVRLRQYDGADRPRLVLDTAKLERLPGKVPGLWIRPLYSQECHPERTALVRWEAGTRFPRHAPPGGEELLILEGLLEDEFGRYPPGSWIHIPALSTHAPFSRRGCLVYARVGGPLAGAQSIVSPAADAHPT